ncbi:MAG: hypothetical protein JSV34_05435 [Candidatus Omnitrophota bacterium]|nr:MAG: hypothetical protein JSV34_05435 [Candidatus Omnitrophota bacterium]
MRKLFLKWTGVLFFCLFTLFFIFVSFSEASVVLKIMGVNPSKEQTQKVILKAYLPKEIKPEHIIDKGDLDLIYDTKEGAYYIYGEYDIAPGETISREVEMKDIWVIPEDELATLRGEAVKNAELLQDTDFEDRVNFLKQSIELKLDKIEEKQSIPPLNSQKHISDYRDNLELLESVKADLFLARSLLTKAKVLPSVTVWKIFIAVIGFLTIIAVVLYFVWHKQLRGMGKAHEGAEEGAEEVMPKEHKTKKEEEIKPEDIEKIIKEEEEQE